MEENIQTQSPQKNNTAKAGIAIVGLIVIVVIAVIAFQAVAGKKSAQLAEDPISTENSMMEGEKSDKSIMMEESSYKNGEYTAVGSYITPGGSQEVGVTLTLTEGIIESVEIDELGTLPISKEKQADFGANYKTQVVGKNIDEVQLSKVSGSSLTPKGFNDALEQIKEEAGA